PALGNLELRRVDDLDDACLNERSCAARTGGPGHEHRAAGQRHANPGRVENRVFFCMTDERVLEGAIRQALGRVFDSSRQPVKARAPDLTVGSYDDPAHSRRRIFAPSGDMARQSEESAIPFVASHLFELRESSFSPSASNLSGKRDRCAALTEPPCRGKSSTRQGRLLSW